MVQSYAVEHSCNMLASRHATITEELQAATAACMSQGACGRSIQSPSALRLVTVLYVALRHGADHDSLRHLPAPRNTQQGLGEHFPSFSATQILEKGLQGRGGASP